MGATFSLMMKPAPFGIFPTFLILSSITMYMLYVFLEGHIKKIGNILPPICKKIANFKVFFGWFVALYGWLLIGSWFVLNVKSVLFDKLWLFSIYGLLIAYPCIISLAVYAPSFLYLRKLSDGNSEKKSIVDSLTIMTISLATPWIFICVFILAFVAIPTWANFLIALAIYITTFFLAIDLPYYQSMEEIKNRKVDGLKAVRQGIIESLCTEKEMGSRQAIELNIQRIDRDIEDIKSEPSHPYSVLKPIFGFVIVSILANLLVEILKVILKI